MTTGTKVMGGAERSAGFWRSDAWHCCRWATAFPAACAFRVPSRHFFVFFCFRGLGDLLERATDFTSANDGCKIQTPLVLETQLALMPHVLASLSLCVELLPWERSCAARALPDLLGVCRETEWRHRDVVQVDVVFETASQISTGGKFGF